MSSVLDISCLISYIMALFISSVLHHYCKANYSAMKINIKIQRQGFEDDTNSRLAAKNKSFIDPDMFHQGSQMNKGSQLNKESGVSNKQGVSAEQGVRVLK